MQSNSTITATMLAILLTLLVLVIAIGDVLGQVKHKRSKSLRIATPDVVEVVATNTDAPPQNVGQNASQNAPQTPTAAPTPTIDPPTSIKLPKPDSDQILALKKRAEEVLKDEELVKLRIELAQRDLKDIEKRKLETVSLYQISIKTALEAQKIPPSMIDQYFGAVEEGVLVFKRQQPTSTTGLTPNTTTEKK